MVVGWGYLYTVSSKVSKDPSLASGFPRVLQGQEYSTLRGNFAESNESVTAEKSVAWPPAADDEKIDMVSTSRRYGSESWMSIGRHEPAYPDLLSVFGASGDSFRPPLTDQTGPLASPAKKHPLDQEGRFNAMANPWPVGPSGLSLNLDANIKASVNGGDVVYQTPGNVRYGAFGDYSVLHGHKIQQLHGNSLMPPPSTQYESSRSRELMSKPVSAHTSEPVKPKDGDYKLFGFSLISSSVTPEPSVSQKNVTSESPGHMHAASYKPQESDRKSELRSSKPADVAAVDDPEKSLQPSQTQLKEVQAKPPCGSARSCTKVNSYLPHFTPI